MDTICQLCCLLFFLPLVKQSILLESLHTFLLSFLFESKIKSSKILFKPFVVGL